MKVESDAAKVLHLQPQGEGAGERRVIGGEHLVHQARPVFTELDA